MQPVNRKVRKHDRFSVFSDFTVFCSGTAFAHVHALMCVISKTNTENVVAHVIHMDCEWGQLMSQQQLHKPINPRGDDFFPWDWQTKTQQHHQHPVFTVMSWHGRTHNEICSLISNQKFNERFQVLMKTHQERKRE